MHGQVSVGVFLAAKETVTVTIQFLNWLDSRGCALQECSQHDIDTWFAAGTATRWRSTRFIYWARKQRIISDITIPARSVRSSPAISDDERIALLRQLLVNDDLIMAHRLIGAFVLLFGQPLSRIVALTRDAIDTSEPIPKTRIAEDWHSLPEPLSTMLCAYLDQRWNANTAANADTKWLFPGTMPRQNMHIMSAAKALRNVGLPALAARNGTWLQLVREAPPLVLAKTLGIDPQTAMRHANRAGTNYLAYSALREQDAAIQLGNSSLSNS